MGVRKDNLKNDKWLAEAFVMGKRVRKWFATKSEATRFYNEMKRQNSPLAQVVVVQKTQPQRLSELAQLWFDLHGQTLVGGKSRLQKLLWIAKVLDDPLARNFTAEMFAEYRAKRIKGEILNDTNKKVPKVSYVNREYDLVRAMFNELIRLKKWTGDNPLVDMRRFRETEKEIYFLRSDEIERLLLACEKSRNPHLKIIVQICLATGARWSEAQDLQSAQVIPYKITFTATKNGKNRSIPISPELYNLLPLKQGRIFAGAYYKACHRAFNRALEKAGINLPEGQATHVLRHTFASHFMMNGGNILVLKDILGHADIKMTMRYAHFSPSHLETAVTLNPLVKRA